VRVWHLLHHARVIIAGVIPCIGHRDPAQPLAIDLAEEGLEQRVSLSRQGALTRCTPVPQIHGPQTFPTAIAHRDGRRGALLPYPLLERNNAAVATNRQR
jgi:hypothetical protein